MIFGCIFPFHIVVCPSNYPFVYSPHKCCPGSHCCSVMSGDDCSGDEVVCPGQDTCVDYGKMKIYYQSSLYWKVLFLQQINKGSAVISLLATCADGIKNQGEFDIDCGGPCHDCPTGELKIC